MKVAYLVNQYPKVSHTFIRREIQALERAGVTVSRFSVRLPNELIADQEDVLEKSRTRILLDEGPIRLARSTLGCLFQRPGRFLRTTLLALRIGRRSERGPLMHLVYLAEACLLLELLQEEGAQHLHAHFGTNSATVAMLCHELGGPPYSFTVHGPEEFDKPDLIALGEKIARSKMVFAVSSFGRSQLYRRCAFSEWPKVHIVRCGVDEGYLKAPPVPPPAAPRAVCVGRLCEAKGQILLVEAAAILARSGLEFEIVLVGDGELRGPIEALIARHGLGQRIRITGWADSKQVRSAILESRALVLPSFAEGLPVAIMEAFALSRPVLSTFVAGIPELVESGKSGWLVPAGSIDDLVTALRSVFTSPPEELARMGREGRKSVELRHDIDEIAGGLVALFGGAAA
jgi:colanic acid/amylovoran biosynthesis glycosyltransferase